MLRHDADRTGSALGLYAVVSEARERVRYCPVRNPGTAYTAIMRPSTGELYTHVRQALCQPTEGPRDATHEVVK